jgi:hypothetical protein
MALLPPALAYARSFYPTENSQQLLRVALPLFLFSKIADQHL